MLIEKDKLRLWTPKLVQISYISNSYLCHNRSMRNCRMLNRTCNYLFRLIILRFVENNFLRENKKIVKDSLSFLLQQQNRENFDIFKFE